MIQAQWPKISTTEIAGNKQASHYTGHDHQQFLVQALGVANLMTLFPRQGWMVAMPVGIVLFAIIHFPHGLLMIVAGVMAGLFIPCYLRDRNLWPLGLYHGWLGTFFYLWVLGKDPWVSVFGK